MKPISRKARKDEFSITKMLKEFLPSINPDTGRNPQGWTNAQLIAMKLIEMAIDKGNMDVIEFIANRVEGRIPQPVATVGKNGEVAPLNGASPVEVVLHYACAGDSTNQPATSDTVDSPAQTAGTA